ncbi:MAG: hypothetical protein C4536_02130 [Actinobacteria bacterium]|jgi:hypothetical protein|nr:MAG: hypothetical protein C4536_02130 [Actinomycetota bacterium]
MIAWTGAEIMSGAKKRVAESAPARIGIGLIALDGRSSTLLEGCRKRLEDYLSTTFTAFAWLIQQEDWDVHWTDPLYLLDRVQASMEEYGWQFCFIVTGTKDHPPVGNSPETLSYSHSAALIDLSGVIPDSGRMDDGKAVAACCRLILASFARLNGLPRLEDASPSACDFEESAPLTAEEKKELEGALQSLADGILRRGVKEIRGLALYARIIFTRPMRVLRTVLSHRPLRMVFSLGKLVFAAMAALVLALLSTELWYLGVGINIWRLILIATAALLAATFYVVFRQRLYVRRVSRSLSEQAAFFNLTSSLTVFSVLLMLFVIIFAVTLLVTSGVYPRYIIEDWVLRGEVGFGDYVRVSLLISSMAMVVGALGAGLEENEHFRQVMYTDKNR